MLPTNWHRFYADRRRRPPTVDSRRRLRVCLGGFLVLLAVVFGRLVQLEATQGEAFREAAARPLVRERSVPGVRGRILGRNGTVLACDQKVLALAVHYRWLQEPADPRWLRRTAWSRLTRAERKDPARVAGEQAEVRRQRQELAQRLAQLAGLSDEEWHARARRVQARVQRIAESVNRRRRAAYDQSESPSRRENGKNDPSPTTAGRIAGFCLEVLRGSMDPSPPERITVAEELDYHVMAEDVPLAVVAEIESRPQEYFGVTIVEQTRRAYPKGTLAAHVLGHLGPVSEKELAPETGPDAYHPDDQVGRLGLERQYEKLLRGRRGEAVEMTDRSGRVLSTYRRTEPAVGRDLVLTLDPELQDAAQSLLDAALARRRLRDPQAPPAGGSVVVMDVHSGALVAAASAPGFDPNLFAVGTSRQREAVLSAAGDPLFDRTARMAIPPGSVFKIVSAAALLESSAVDSAEPLFCQGFLETPDRWRCAIYRRHGTGHGDVTLADALAVSCNVYFFHRAAELGPGPLVDWAGRFGFGRPTGVDLPGESPGTLPTPETIGDLEGHPWHTADSRLLSVGQGSLEATPLQVARMIAAVANGGLLVTPHVASHLGLPELAEGQSPADLPEDPIRPPPPQPIPGLDAQALATIREGLERVVTDPQGTAHATVYMASLPIAGKTGTAETGPRQAEHAWFAGYLPADHPRFALVVALEHAGNASEAACPVAKRVAVRMKKMGYFKRPL